ncbi:hypothetical protein MASR2M15_29630 [Anaerolineales bacterium]
MSKADRDSSNNDLKRISKATQKDALPHIQSAIPQDPDPSTSGDELDLDAIIVPDASSQEIEAFAGFKLTGSTPLTHHPAGGALPAFGGCETQASSAGKPAENEKSSATRCCSSGSTAS